ncbi:MAG: glycoside hydrolase family 65 protein [Kiritimatiellaceae bacterium]|nr:glycoside hydrolase family 65 protein [Kiritimatiellaceae bacterium]
MEIVEKMKPFVFEPQAWDVTEHCYDWKVHRRNETVFAIGNGYLGIRGCFEEGFHEEDQWHTEPNTCINGIYEYQTDGKGGHRYKGYPTKRHGMPALPNGFKFSIYLDGEHFHLAHGKNSEYRRNLDMKRGLLTREFVWESPNGKMAKFTFERFTSMDNFHIVGTKVTVTPINFSGEIRIVSELGGPVKNMQYDITNADGTIIECLETKTAEMRDDAALLRRMFKGSQIQVCVAAKTFFKGAASGTPASTIKAGKICEAFTVSAEKNQTVSAEKIACYYTTKDCAENNLEAQTLQTLKQVADAGYDAVKAAHMRAWATVWDVTDMEIDGDLALQQAIRFSLFHTLQSTGRQGWNNIGANGLSGISKYQGHYFWDTEIYVLPFYTYTFQQDAKNLLMYRYSILDRAREQAKIMDDTGAHFSWNSISGEECGVVYEASHAQYHINNAVAFGIYRYFEATGDKEFLYNYCAEVLFETARCMAHRGNFIEAHDGKFCINVVCGPDEYGAMVNNNCYTNMLTKFHLEFALKVLGMLKAEAPAKYDELVKKCELTDKEQTLWRQAAEKMYIPYNEKLGLYMQDDSFIYKDPLDPALPKSEWHAKYVKTHPLNTWRHQIIKQADTVLLTFLLNDSFSLEEKKRIYDYYEPKTLHSSSLSPSIHSIIASEIGYQDAAYNFFMKTARMDIDDYSGSTFFGNHAACMASSWMVMVNGFAGFRIVEGQMHFNPWMPAHWNRVTFKIVFQGSTLQVTLTKSVNPNDPTKCAAKFELLNAGEVNVFCRGEKIKCSKV